MSGLLSLGVHLGMQSTLQLTRRLGIPPSAPGFLPLGREIVVLVLNVVALVVIVVFVVAVAVVVKVAVARVVVVEVIRVVVSLHWQEQDNYHILIEVRKLFACIFQCLTPMKI